MKKLFMLFIGLVALSGCQHYHDGHPCSYYQEKLETPVYFQFDKTDINPEAKAGIDQGIEFLRTHRFRSIKIDAYADMFGSEEYNMALTKKRAEAIRDYIISQGIAEKRIKIYWHGIEEDKTGKYKDHRRVDVSVM